MAEIWLPALMTGLIGVVAYAVGSLSSGYFVGKLYRNVDLRRVGSGSTGATNTFRNLGPGAGILVALLDILKGASAVFIARQIVPDGSSYLPVAEAAAALGAVIGHCWPAFTEGRGGRGVATAFGAFMFIATSAWVAAVIAFVLAIAFTRIVSVASLASVAGALAGYGILTWLDVTHFHPATLVFVLVAGGIIVWRHRPNIERIMRGAEPRVLS
jgi:acyl phosphate:glycerol-3-phosphate acyltransferase